MLAHGARRMTLSGVRAMSDNVPEEFEQFALAHGLGLDRMDGF